MKSTRKKPMEVAEIEKKHEEKTEILKELMEATQKKYVEVAEIKKQQEEETEIKEKLIEAADNVTLVRYPKKFEYGVTFNDRILINTLVFQ